MFQSSGELENMKSKDDGLKDYDSYTEPSHITSMASHFIHPTTSGSNW